jgi:hypothetical protein
MTAEKAKKLFPPSPLPLVIGSCFQPRGGRRRSDARKWILADEGGKAIERKKIMSNTPARCADYEMVSGGSFADENE